MSHVVTITTKVKDIQAIRAACLRLNLAEPVHGVTKLFTTDVTGWVVQLPNWHFPIVINTETGDIQFDNYNGRWGKQEYLDRFMQAYAVEMTRQQARRKHYSVTEQTLKDGSIRLQILEGR